MNKGQKIFLMTAATLGVGFTVLAVYKSVTNNCKWSMKDILAVTSGLVIGGYVTAKVLSKIG